MNEETGLNIPSFITVRTDSSRLQRKCLLPFGEGNVLEHIIRRTKHYKLEPIVCTTTEASDDIVKEISQKERAKCFRGSKINKLKRWLDCCCNFDVLAFHTIDADDPFFDGHQVEKSFRLLQQGFDVVFPPDSSSMGGASVGYSLTRDIVSRCCESIGEDEDTEMMWSYLKKLPGLRQTKLPEEDANPMLLRLTLDYEEDYWLLRSIQRIVGSLASRREVEDLFRRNPDLYLINWFRSKEWKDKQVAKELK
jgi:spore coat polysaccharide biosynthesis protein SpsF (cytidylyltransferase family)